MKTVALGDLLTPAPVRRAGSQDYTLLSMTMHEGLVEQSSRFSKRVAGRDLTQYKVVESGQLVVSFPIDEGVLDFLSTPASGIVSPAYRVWDLVNNEVAHRPYLKRYLRSPRALGYYHAKMRGSTARRRSLPEADFLDMPVPLPTLNEQRRIAAILERADALRAKRRQVLAHLDALTQSIFHDMFSTEANNVALGDVCLRITDGTHQSPEWSDQGVPFLFVSNITSGEIDFETKKHVSHDVWRTLTRRCPIEVGDVLYSTVGSYGFPAVVRTNDPFAFQRHIAHIKPDQDVLLPDFLSAQLSSSPLRQQAARVARGIAQPTVNLASIREFSIVVPRVARQKEFVTRVTPVSEMKLQAREVANELTALVDSLQSRAFSGRL